MGLQQYLIFVVTWVKALTIPLGRKKMQDKYLKIGLDRDWGLKKDHPVFIGCYAPQVLCSEIWSLENDDLAGRRRLYFGNMSKMHTRTTRSIVKSQAWRGVVRGLFKQGIQWGEQQHSQDRTLNMDRGRGAREMRETSGALCSRKKKKECFKEGTLSLEGTANMSSVAEDDQQSCALATDSCIVWYYANMVYFSH